MEYIEKLDYLDDYLDDFIERNVTSHRVYNEETFMEEYRKTIQLKRIYESKLNEEEYEYAFYYLKERKIDVSGTAYALCGYFDNYKYHQTRKKIEYVNNDEKIEVSELEDMMNKYIHMAEGKEKTALRDLLLRSNMPLVHSVVNKYSNLLNIDNDELFSYGCEGLIQAFDSYMPDNNNNNNNNKFSTYAFYKIKGFILHGIPEILGFDDRNLYYQIIKLKKKVDEKNGIQSDSYMDVIDDILDLLVKDNCIITKEDRLHQMNIYNPISIEDLEVEDASFLIEEVIDNVFHKQAEAEILECIGNYDSYDVLIPQFGLDGKEIKTCEEIGKKLGYTRQNVSLVKQKALKKMSHSRKFRALYRDSLS